MRSVRKLLSYLVFGVLVIIMGAVAAGYYYQDKLVMALTKEINPYLKTKINVSEIEFSLIQNFPKASFAFHQISVQGVDAYGNPKDTLVVADKLSVSFDIADFLDQKYTLTSVGVEKGMIYATRFRNGNANWEVFNLPEDTTSQTFQVALNKISLQGVSVFWQDDQTRKTLSVYAENLKAKGDFNQESYSLAVYGKAQNLTSNYYSYPNLAGKKLHVDVAFDCAPNFSYGVVSRGWLNIDDEVKLRVAGKWDNKINNWSLTLDKTNINTLKLWIPSEYKSYMEQLDVTGETEFEVELAANSSGAVDVVVTGEMSNVSYTVNDSLQFHNVSGAFVYKNQKGANDVLEVDGLAFQSDLGSGVVTGTIDNLQKPNINAQVEVHSQLNSFQSYWSTALEGDVQWKGRVSGRFNDWNALLKQWHQLSVSGSGSLKNVRYQANGYTIILKEASLELTDEQCDLLSIECTVNGNEFKGSAVWNDWQKAINDNQFYIQADVFSPVLVVDSLLMGATAETTGEFRLPENLAIQGKVTADLVKYQKHVLQQTSAWVMLESGILEVANLRADYNEGQIQMNLKAENKFKSVAFRSDFIVQHLNVTQTFTVFDNFDQEGIKAEHLSGYLSAKGETRFQLMADGTLNWDNLYLKTLTEITDGKLTQYPPITGIPAAIKEANFLAKFVKLDDFEERLQVIEFDTLFNEITIDKGWIYIPNMSIHSTAMDLQISGQHSLDNRLDYKLQFDLKDVLLRKNSPTETDFGVIEDDATGQRMIFLKIYGTLDHFEVDLDKTASKAYKQQAKAEEVQTAKQVLRDELGLFKSSLEESEEEQEEENWDLDVSDMFEEDSATSDSIDTTTVKRTETKNTKDTTATKGIKKWLKPNDTESEEDTDIFDDDEDDF